MEQTFTTTEIEVGFHPDGYRIVKTVSPMNRYTQWQLLSDGHWCNPKPVCFDSLPQQDWFAQDKFDWDKLNIEDFA
jgi:hypothetical protein